MKLEQWSTVYFLKRSLRIIFSRTKHVLSNNSSPGDYGKLQDGDGLDL